MCKQVKFSPLLRDVLRRYGSHPEFIGIELVDVNQKGAVDNAPLHLAASSGRVGDIEALVAGGADLDLPGDLGNTPLHFSALMGHKEAVKTLLRLGANPRILNEFDQTPLAVAEIGKDYGIANLLKPGSVS